VPWLVIVVDAAGATAVPNNSGAGGSRSSLSLARAYALVELGDSEAIDPFLRQEDAQAALEGALRDEPDWAGTLSVKPVETRR
jgi:hypothetical protein